MAKYTGKAMKVYFGTFDVSGAGRNLEVNRSADEVDVSTYGSVEKEFVVGLPERSATLEILDDSTNPVIRQQLAVGSSGSLTWFPIGTASGNPKFTAATALVREANQAYPYDGAVTIATTLRLSGGVVEGTADGTGK